MSSGREEVYECSGGGALVSKSPDDDSLKTVRATLAFKLGDCDPDRGSVTAEGISPLAAFEVFAGKTFHQQQTLFTLADSVERRAESPMQRFARLRGELDDLSRDLDSMVKGEADGEATVWSVLKQEARQMIAKLVELEDHSGAKLYKSKADSLAQRFDEVSSKILKNVGAAPAPAPSPSSSAPADYSEVVALERRVSALETMLGYASNLLDTEGSARSSSSSSGSSSFPLVETVSRLEKRVALLDPATLDTLRTKAGQLKNDLEASQKIKGSAQEQQTLAAAAKVDGLFERVERVRVAAEEVPALVLRLKTLEHVHSSAALFTQRLDQMERSVGALSDELKSNGAVLASLSEGLKENVKTIKDIAARKR
jgi:nuclear migration protein JNM1